MAFALGVVWGSPAAASTPQDQAPEVVQPGDGVEARLAAWVVASGDNAGLPFVIIDKVAAQIWVYRADGHLRGAAPALLGFARGDDSAPGVGDRELSDIAPEERTTPAGRFTAAFGPAAGGRRVLWVDYGTAISLHPVVTAKPRERRLQRLRSASPEDNRITFGCINVSAAFYEKVVRKSFTGTRGIVYILPEIRPLGEVFPAFGLQEALGPGPALADAAAPGGADAVATVR